MRHHAADGRIQTKNIFACVVLGQERFHFAPDLSVAASALEIGVSFCGPQGNGLGKNFCDSGPLAPVHEIYLSSRSSHARATAQSSLIVLTPTRRISAVSF